MLHAPPFVQGAEGGAHYLPLHGAENGVVSVVVDLLHIRFAADTAVCQSGLNRFGQGSVGTVEPAGRPVLQLCGEACVVQGGLCLENIASLSL